MKNTEKSFRDKWTENPGLAFNETANENSKIFNWILNRNGFSKKEEFSQYLADKESILDAGCGNGRITSLLNSLSPNKQITGIDLVAHEVAAENLKEYENIQLFQKDLLTDLSDLGQFDYIYCQEVLHHTSDPKAAFLNLCSLLSPKGQIAIYVYKKKAPIREFTDEYVREKISGLPYEDAMKFCDQVTKLGKTLSETNIKIQVPSIDLLEIEEGEYDLQRFFYHFFMKCFWNDNLDFHDNSVINYDWYHPQDCSKHSLDEIKSWFLEAGLSIEQECVDFYGITVRGKNK